MGAPSRPRAGRWRRPGRRAGFDEEQERDGERFHVDRGQSSIYLSTGQVPDTSRAMTYADATRCGAAAARARGRRAQPRAGAGRGAAAVRRARGRGGDDGGGGARRRGRQGHGLPPLRRSRRSRARAARRARAGAPGAHPARAAAARAGRAAGRAPAAFLGALAELTFEHRHLLREVERRRPPRATAPAPTRRGCSTPCCCSATTTRCVPTSCSPRSRPTSSGTSPSRAHPPPT